MVSGKRRAPRTLCRVTAHGVSSKEQLTFLLGRHDPAQIFGENPDAPPDEYSSEAEEILARLQRGASEQQVREVVWEVFTAAVGHDEVDNDAIARAALDIHRVLKS